MNKIPLTSTNVEVGASIMVTTKGFSVSYESATITEVKPLGSKGAIIKFVTESGSKNQLTAKPIAVKNFQGVYQAYLA